MNRKRLLCFSASSVSSSALAGYETYCSAAATPPQDSMYPDENETVRQLLHVCVCAGSMDFHKHRPSDDLNSDLFKQLHTLFLPSQDVPLHILCYLSNILHSN